MLTHQAGNQNQGLAPGPARGDSGYCPGLGVKAGGRRRDRLGLTPRTAPSSFMWRGPQGGQGARLGCGSDTSRC